MKNSKLNDFINRIANYQLALFGTDSHIRANLFTSPYKQASKKIKSATSQNEVFKALDDLIDEFKKNLDEQAFIKAFANLTFKKSKARKGLESFPASHAIKQISRSLNNKGGLDYDNVSIEHIIDEKNENEDVQKIGNLTILENGIHDSINKDQIDKYDDKITYYSGSSSVMTENLVKDYEEFDLDKIDERGKQLAKYYYDNCL